MSELLPQGKSEGYGACSDDVTFALGWLTARLPCDSDWFPARRTGLRPSSLRSIRACQPALALRRKVRPRTGL